MEFILVSVFIVVIAGIAAWRYFSVNAHVIVESDIAPYKVEEATAPVVNSVDASVKVPSKIKAKKPKAPVVIVEAVAVPVAKSKKTKAPAIVAEAVKPVKTGKARSKKI